MTKAKIAYVGAHLESCLARESGVSSNGRLAAAATCCAMAGSVCYAPSPSSLTRPNERYHCA